MSTEKGLRERKKERTRQAISDAAQRLLMERGFDDVTVAEVARAADVSEGTVFNYFPTKEDLFYSGMESFEAALVDAVRERAAGKPVLAAFRDFVLERSSRLEAEEVADLIATADRIVSASSALQAREREIVATYTDLLAELIAEEAGVGAEDVEPRVVASALMGAHRALRVYVHAKVRAGQRGPALASSARAQAKRAFGRLERGLGAYGEKR